MNHTQRYLIKTLLAVFRNVIIGPRVTHRRLTNQSGRLHNVQKPPASQRAGRRTPRQPAPELNLQHLQVGEAAEGPVGDEADAVASDVELLEQAEAGEAGLLQPGQMVGGEVAATHARKTRSAPSRESLISK